MGDLFRKGLPSSMCPNIEHLLGESAKARTEVARGQPPRLEHIVPNTPEEVPKDAPTYRTPRGAASEFTKLVFVKKCRRHCRILILRACRYDIASIS